MLISLIFPLVTGCLFLTSTFPNLPTNTQQKSGENIFKNKWFWLCFFAIFLGGATECTMAQWSSSYLEKVINIPKIWGDILGVALFSVMLGLGRTLYSKYGKNIISLLFILAIGSACCYLVCAICPIPIISLIACFLTGLFSSMLWPGTLIVSTDKIPKGGIMLFALMASGGDLGASVAPQLLGSITDFIIHVIFFGKTFRKNIGHDRYRFRLKCKKEHTRRAFIQTVHGNHLSIDLISKQLNGKTSLVPIDFRTMHKKFRRLIDRNECVVFI